jgi:hypothetical protein
MSNNNIDHMLSMRAQTLSGGNNYGTTNDNGNLALLNDKNQSQEETKSPFLQPLNLCLLVSIIVILFILFLLMVIYK